MSRVRRAAIGRADLCLVAAVCLSLIALLVRMYNLDHEPLWLDEGYTLLFSSLDLPRLLTIGGAHEHPPLFYLLTHLLMQLDHSYLVIRSISAVAGSCSVLVLYLLGARLWGRPAGLVAAALLTVAPFHVWFSRDGRAYELAGLFLLLSYLFLFTSLERPSPGTWVGYGVCLALCLYTEYTTVFVLLPQAILLLQARRQGMARAMLSSWLLGVLLLLPWLGMLARNVSSVAGDYWIPVPTPDRVTNTLLEFLGGVTPCPAYPCTGSEAQVPLLVGHEQIAAAILITAVGLTTLWSAVRVDVRLLTICFWLVLPFVLVLLLATRRSLYLDRVFLDATYPLYLLIGALVTSLAQRKVFGGLGVVAAVFLFIASTANTRLVYSQSLNPDWRTASREFAAVYRSGQAVVYNPGVLQSLVGAYLPAGLLPTRQVRLWYHGYLDLPGWQQRFARLKSRILNDSTVPAGQRYARFDDAIRDRELQPLLGHAPQVWLLTEDYSGLSDARRWFLLHGYEPVLSELYPGDARLELWVRGGPDIVGPPIWRAASGARWQISGEISLSRNVITEQGHALAVSSFSATSGQLYSVNVEYRTFPPGSASVSIQTFNSSGQVVGSMVDRFGTLLNSFPRTEWYLLPATGVWTMQPFGFIAPPGATRAVIRLQTSWGMTQWRHLVVYQQHR
ncbi:MAG TPA: glycosyltransferase family 39 protein [Chloroflexota bacterium]